MTGKGNKKIIEARRSGSLSPEVIQFPEH